MKRNQVWVAVSKTLETVTVTVIVTLMLASGAWAAKYKVLHRFHGRDAAVPTANLIFDAAGNLYGTTAYGGNQSCSGGCGTAFELLPGANGQWTAKVLQYFDGRHGATPYAGLIFDVVGNLYGAAYRGGKNGYGNVFELIPHADGTWTEKGLHSFNHRNGAYPWRSLIFDAAGNLYGTTASGCTYGGTVFKMSPNQDGGWTENVLYNGSFLGAQPDGVTFDASGNLYFTTLQGGPCCNGAYGVVFWLGHGELYNFTARGDGVRPLAGVIFDTAGNLYGTASGGGTYGQGTIFKLAPRIGRWHETTLHNFNGYDGAGPAASLISDSAGNLYGTTTAGGDLNNCSGKGCGVVFEITP